MTLNPKFIYFISVYVAFVLTACTNRYQSQVIDDYQDPLKDLFVDANKQMIQIEEKKIDSLLALLNIPFFKHSTGIRLCIDSVENDSLNACPIDGSSVTVAYNCMVFDAYDLVLDNSFIDTINFKIGYSKQMRGLNYAIKLLKVGDKAKIVIPSYLGFGMSGYEKSVPPYSTLFLNVKLLNIQE